MDVSKVRKKILGFYLESLFYLRSPFSLSDPEFPIGTKVGEGETRSQE